MKINYKWIAVIIIGGLLMIIGTFDGLPILTILIDLYFNYGAPYVSRAVGKNLASLLNILLTVIFYIISGGGISVIIGAVLVLARLQKIGKIVISLGSGMGLIGIIILIMWRITFETPGSIFIQLIFNIYFIGVLITLIGRRKFKKDSEEEFNEQIIAPTMQEYQDQLCPTCSSSNPVTNAFCRKCGTNLNSVLEKYL